MIRKAEKDRAERPLVAPLFGLHQNILLRSGHRDFVGKSSADERELYDGTASEETTVE